MNDFDRGILRQHFVDALPGCAIILLDVEGNVLTWNAGARAILGYAAGARHGDVGEQQVDIGDAGEHLERLRAVRRCDDPIAEALQLGKGHLVDPFIVLHDKNLFVYPGVTMCSGLAAPVDFGTVTSCTRMP